MKTTTGGEIGDGNRADFLLYLVRTTAFSFLGFVNNEQRRYLGRGGSGTTKSSHRVEGESMPLANLGGAMQSDCSNL